MIELYLGRLEIRKYNYWDNDRYSLFYVSDYSKETKNRHYLIQLCDDYLEPFNDRWNSDDYEITKYLPPGEILEHITKVIVVEGELKETKTEFLQRYGRDFNTQRKYLIFGEGAFERYTSRPTVLWEYIQDNVIVTKELDCGED
jgi:hypothetical protein